MVASGRLVEKEAGMRCNSRVLTNAINVSEEIPNAKTVFNAGNQQKRLGASGRGAHVEGLNPTPAHCSVLNGRVVHDGSKVQFPVAPVLLDAQEGTFHPHLERGGHTSSCSVAEDHIAKERKKQPAPGTRAHMAQQEKHDIAT
jgi:hypothetical protein